MSPTEIKVGHVYRGRRGPDRLCVDYQPTGSMGGAYVGYHRRLPDGRWSPARKHCWNVTFADWVVEDLGEHSNAEDAARG